MQQKQMDRNIVEMLDALEKNRNESLIFWNLGVGSIDTA